jgi:antitoxin component YwqK of YwqJK toxin-antitoxin module
MPPGSEKHFLPFLQRRFLFFILLIPLFAFSQKTKVIYYDEYQTKTTRSHADYYRIIHYDSGGKPIGIVREYYMTKKIKWQGKLLADDPKDVFDSICCGYYQNGKKEYRTFYINGKREGIDSSFYENGQLRYAIHFKNDLIEGENIDYDKNGSIYSRCFYVHGELSGSYIYYFPNGTISSKSNYVNGLKEGKAMRWYESGKLWEQKNYHKDTLDGESVSYYENGGVRTKENYKMGNDIGVRYEFYNNNDTSGIYYFSSEGRRLDAREYYPGLRIMQRNIYDAEKDRWDYISYFEDGNISKWETEIGYHPQGRQVAFFANGKFSRTQWYGENGEHYDTTWFESGELKRIDYSFNDVLISGIEYDRQGNKINEEIADSLKVHIAKDNISCFYGLKDFHDNWVIRPKYTFIQYPQNGFFLVNDNEKWGLVSVTGKEILAPQYESLLSLSSSKRYSFSSYGESYSSYRWDFNYQDNYGLFVAEKNGKYGLINLSNKIIVPFEFCEINYTGNTHFSLTKEKPKPPRDPKDSGVFFVRIDYELDEWDDLSSFSDNYLFGYGDTTGFISEIKYGHPVYFDGSDLSVFYCDTTRGEQYKWHNKGVINYSGKVIVPPVYDEIRWIHDLSASTVNAFWVTKNGKTGLIDHDGKIILDTIYRLNVITQSHYKFRSQGFFFNDSMAIVSLNGKSGIVAPDGHFILPLLYDSLNIYSSSCIIYGKNNKYGLLGQNLKPKSKKMYSSLMPIYYPDGTDQDLKIQPGLILAAQNGKFGIINAGDSIVIPFKYEHFWFERSGYHEYIYFTTRDSVFAVDLENSSAPAKINYEFKYGVSDFTDYVRYGRGEDKLYCYGIVNEGGKIILQPEYDIICIEPDVIVFEDSTGRTGIMPQDEKPQMLPSQFQKVHYIGEGYLNITTSTGKVGLINCFGKLMVDTVFYFFCVNDPTDYAFWVKTAPGDTNDRKDFFSGEWGYIDTNGRYILKPVWDHPVFFYHDSIGIVHDKTGYCLVRQDGKILLQPGYDHIFRDWNDFFILEKNNKYGFANKNGKVIVEPKWNKISGFQGNGMFCYDENGNVEVVDTAGKNISGGSFSDMMNCTAPLSDFIFFKERTYRTDPDFARYKSIELDEKASGYHLLDSITNEKVYRKVSNFVIALAVTNDTSLIEIEYLTSFPNADLYWNGKWEDTASYKRREYYKNEITIVNATAQTFSLVENSNDCQPGLYFSDNCDRKTIFMNYAISGDSVFPQTLKMLFDTTKDYKNVLNEIVYQHMSKMDDPDISCSNPQTYMDQIGEHFTLSQDSIIFYMPYNQGNFNDVDIKYCIRVPVAYSEIKNILNPNGALGNFAPKSSKKKKRKKINN